MSNEVKYTPEQQRIIRETEGRMIVSASAGSGKTTVMIERIVGLVKKGVGLDEIVAVTFTEASARDMRAKLERKITELALSDPKYIAELEKLPFAEICTVDSLCKRIVSENFEIAGIDPAFDLVDSSEKEEFSREAFEFACKQMAKLEQNAGGRTFGVGLVELQKLMGGKDGLRAEIERAASFLSSLPDEKKWLNEVALCVHRSEVIDELNDRLLKRVKREAKDLREVAGGFSPAVCELTFVATRLDILDEALKGDGWAFLRRERLPSVYKDQIEKAGGDVSVIVPWCDCVKALCDERNYDYGDEQDIEGEVMDLYFVTLLGLYVDALLEIKLSENKLDFYDVEKIALDILRNGEVRQKVLEKYSYVFVDEYQDINELQDELIQRLTGDNLFMVGDVKHSIYMFRHSEPSIFVNATKKNPEELVALKENFRSDSGVIDKVNEVFSNTS